MSRRCDLLFRRTLLPSFNSFPHHQNSWRPAMLPNLQSLPCGMSVVHGLVCWFVLVSFWHGWLSCSLLLGLPGSLYDKVSLGENCSLAGEPGVPMARTDGNQLQWIAHFLKYPHFKCREWRSCGQEVHCGMSGAAACGRSFLDFSSLVKICYPG